MGEHPKSDPKQDHHPPRTSTETVPEIGTDAKASHPPACQEASGAGVVWPMVRPHEHGKDFAEQNAGEAGRV